MNYREVSQRNGQIKHWISPNSNKYAPANNAIVPMSTAPAQYPASG